MRFTHACLTLALSAASWLQPVAAQAPQKFLFNAFIQSQATICRIPYDHMVV